jgi:hypothetical protein
MTPKPMTLTLPKIVMRIDEDKVKEFINGIILIIGIGFGLLILSIIGSFIYSFVRPIFYLLF